MKNYWSNEYFVPINENPHVLGRIVLIEKNDSTLVSEIDLIFKESGKIYAPVGRIDNLENKDDALSLSRQKLSLFLLKKE